MAKKLKSDFKPKKNRINLFGVELEGTSEPSIQLLGNKEVSVEGCKGVVDYYETQIKLRLPKGYIIFRGDGLSIFSLTDTSALIRGKIGSIEFEGNVSV